MDLWSCKEVSSHWQQSDKKFQWLVTHALTQVWLQFTPYKWILLYVHNHNVMTCVHMHLYMAVSPAISSTYTIFSGFASLSSTLAGKHHPTTIIDGAQNLLLKIHKFPLHHICLNACLSAVPCTCMYKTTCILTCLRSYAPFVT